MARFHFHAIDAAGIEQQGVIEATDQAAAVAALRREGRLPVRVGDAPVQTGIRGAKGIPKLGVGEVTELTRELALMLAAGQDLDRALRYLGETAANRRAAASAGLLRDQVRNGAPFAKALAGQPRNFSPLYLGMVQAGEAGGSLAAALAGLADAMERDRALAATVRTAMIYPAILLVASVAAIILILTQVLPQFIPLFAAAGASLPASATFLVATGDFIADDGFLVLLGVCVGWLLGKAALRNPAVAFAADRLLLSLPVIGNLLREALAARFTRTLGTLLGNGVPLIVALRIVAGVMLNRCAASAITDATEAAASGAGMAIKLAEARVFPVRTTQLLRLGEENAELGPMALRAAAIHEDRTRMAVQRLLAALVPAITIIMGGVVAAIVATLLSAMLSLNDLAS